MNTLDKARETQLKNIQTRLGKTLTEVRTTIQESGLTQHGEIRQMFIDQFGLSYGDANALVHYALSTDGQSHAQATGASMEEILVEIYSGAKAPLRPFHDQLLVAIETLGPFEIVPKKGYVSLRRQKQFAMVGPASKGRVEVGLNMKGVPATERLIAQPPGGMCQYKVYLSTTGEVDPELLAWIKLAYESAA